jgi:hypothetical protein
MTMEHKFTEAERRAAMQKLHDEMEAEAIERNPALAKWATEQGIRRPDFLN